MLNEWRSKTGGQGSGGAGTGAIGETENRRNREGAKWVLGRPGGHKSLRGVESTLEITTRNDTDDGDRFRRNSVKDAKIAGS